VLKGFAKKRFSFKNSFVGVCSSWAAPLFVVVLFCNMAQAEQQVIVYKLKAPPVLDGDLSEWPFAATTLALNNFKPESKVTVNSIDVYAGHYEDVIYFAFRWADATQDLQHKPYTWDNEESRYVMGAQREDRLALQFEMQGDYSANWASGNEFVADMWHWKSSRSAPIGCAHDKMTIVSRKKLSKAYKLVNEQGLEIYIRRPSDSGDKLYKSMRYGLKEKALMQKYLPNYDVTGSVADVKARSKWRDGYWVLELERAFDTGHDDDVKFLVGSSVKGGLALFNRSEEDDHAISQTLRFVIKAD
jgi:Ethylbenzene dehydrogenase